MPHINLKIPRGSFPGQARAELVRRIIDAAATAEQMPDDPVKRALCWLVVEEVEPGLWTCGARDLSAQLLTCFAIVHVPAGVLDAAARALYVTLMHEAFLQARPTGDARPLATSVILQEVADGTWGGNGAIWTLPTLAKAAGYAHLQHLVPA